MLEGREREEKRGKKGRVEGWSAETIQISQSDRFVSLCVCV